MKNRKPTIQITVFLIRNYGGHIKVEQNVYSAERKELAIQNSKSSENILQR